MSAVITFAPVARSSERTVNANSTREPKAAKQARWKAIFLQGGFSYKGIMPLSIRTALKAGQAIDAPELGLKGVSLENPKALACTVCGDTHKLTDVNLSGKITFLTKGETTIVLSDSCRQDYFGPYASKALDQASLIVYRNDFAKVQTK